MDELATVRVRVSDFERCNADLDRLEDENERLKETNRKLTEILKDALPALNSMCGECCYQQECYSSPDCIAMEQTAARMRDLGIEVE